MRKQCMEVDGDYQQKKGAHEKVGLSLYLALYIYTPLSLSLSLSVNTLEVFL